MSVIIPLLIVVSFLLFAVWTVFAALRKLPEKSRRNGLIVFLLLPLLAIVLCFIIVGLFLYKIR